MADVKEILQTKVMLYIMGHGMAELAQIDDEFKEELEDYDKCVTLREYIKEREEYERSYRPS